jgi:deazaflavin-dependent oxidoreductase (nitroreductase family)
VPLFERLADQDVAYLTTIGRKSGKPHRIEIWFAIDSRRLYLLSGGGDAADWIRNIRRNGRVRVQVGSRTVTARARIARRGAEDRRARELLDAKYMDWKPGKRLSAWAHDAVPVAIDLPAG